MKLQNDLDFIEERAYENKVMFEKYRPLIEILESRNDNDRKR